MKKTIAALLCASMFVTLAACGVSTDTGDGSTTGASGMSTDTGTESSAGTDSTGKDFSGESIEVAVRYTGSTLDTFTELTNKFENESGCKVEITSYGQDDYENSLKTRMASNTLPDVFETHGWSILRYKEYHRLLHLTSNL